MKKVSGRLWLLTLMFVASVVFFLPSYQPAYQTMPSWLREVLPNKGITLGLDLQGGIHMVLEVDEDRAVEIAVDRSVAALQDLVAEKNWQSNRRRERRTTKSPFWRRMPTRKRRPKS